jgi:photosystem II stability/assembly factor-like uncharacterized protein
MDKVIFIGTSNGLVVGESRGEGWHVSRYALQGHYITSVAAEEGVLLAGTQDGVYRSDDKGITWQEVNAGLSIRHIRWLVIHPNDRQRAFVGSEPAAIFISLNSGRSWRLCPEVEQLRKKHGWSLPYSPQAGCVRGFALLGTRGYAAVEDGCVLVSKDAGETWNLPAGSRGDPDHMPRPGFVHSDVHSIEVHPVSPDLVAAPTGGGFFLSSDGGSTWENLFRNCYCRATWLDPTDPNHVILGPADFVDRNGRIEQTHDGGHTWQLASVGLDVPWRHHMVERFTQVGDELLAILSNGDLLSANLSDLKWQQILPEVKDVNAVAVMK